MLGKLVGETLCSGDAACVLGSTWLPPGCWDLVLTIELFRLVICYCTGCLFVCKSLIGLHFQSFTSKFSDGGEPGV
jgi:hypothetical protein